MPTKNLGKLRDNSNVAILNAIRNDGSMDYRSRIPAATKANIRDVVSNLTKYRPLWNEFENALVNRIGDVYARNMIWTNPLGEFKRGMLNYGDTIEEVQVGLLNAHVYDPHRDYMEESLFGTETPDTRSIFHTVNRQEFYKISVNEPLLQRAFLEEGGLNSFVSKMMDAPTTSDQWDEFMLTCSLFSEYEHNGGFYHVNVPDLRALSATDVDAKSALKKIRAMADTLKFPSTRYNAAHMPSFAQPEDLLIFTTPEFIANIDVEALAAAFNIDRADVHGRIIPIPAEQFGIDGAQAILTTRDFFVIADQRIENTSQYNPVSLTNNYFLHHWEIISASTFVPAVMFTTGKDDEVITILPKNVAVGTITVKDAEGQNVTKAVAGQNVQITAALTGDNVDGVGVLYTLAGAKSQRTHVDNTGVLTVGYDETAATLTMTATPTWVDPADPTKVITGKDQSVTVDVSTAETYWPKPAAVAAEGESPAGKA